MDMRATAGAGLPQHAGDNPVNLNIPFQRYAGSVVAFGRYGLPTFAGIRLTRRQGAILAIVGLLVVLSALGVVNIGHALAGGGIVLGAGPTATMSATDYAEKLHSERTKFKSWYDEHIGADGQINLDAEGVKKFREWNADLAKLNDEYKSAFENEAIVAANEGGLKDLERPQRTLAAHAGQPGDRPAAPVIGKSLGERFVESKEFKDSLGLARGASGPAYVIDLEKEFGKAVAARGVAELKTLFDTASSFAVQNIRLPQPITPGSQAPTVASLMPEGRTSQAAIAYMEETTTTNSAAETAESGSKPESALAFTEKTSAVRKIATSLPITDESLEDVPFIESYIDSRLSLFVRQREDAELVAGNGTAPNLRGFLNVSGINTQARGSDASQDAIFKAGTLVQTTSFLFPTGVVINPTNWQTIRLMTTSTGIYLFGPPSQPGDNTLWGWDVVSTTAMTLNSALVGAFQTGAEVFRRSDLSMQVGWINDQFVKNQRTILVEERLALVVFRPLAFCKVTSLN
jgi:HK97 family phage major capsid protein